MKKYIAISLSLILPLLAIGCSRHNIAGTDYGWSRGDIKVLSDIQVSNLQIRHVRMSNTVCTDGFQDHLELNGEIGPDSTYVIEQLLRKVNKCEDKNTGVRYSTIIYLNSGGGLLKDGYSLGRMLRNNEVQTVVAGGQFCASACSVAFLGGKFRSINNDGKLLFHSPYIKNQENSIVCTSRENSSDLNFYFQEMLSYSDGQRVFDRTMDYCSTSNGWTINKDAAAIFKITTN